MRRTHSQDIFKTLANDIVTGRIAPGQKFEERAIAKQFAVSRTPVREALRQLIGTGLAEPRPRGGVTVARIDGAQLGEMFEALGEFEALCAKLSAQRMTEVERQKLRISAENFATAASVEDLTGFAALNEQFHQMIYRGPHNNSIEQITQGFRQRLAPFRVPTFYLIAGRLHSSVREHREIVSAIVTGDGDRACQAMRTHVASTSVNVIDYFEKMRAGVVPAHLPRTASNPALHALPQETS